MAKRESKTIVFLPIIIIGALLILFSIFNFSNWGTTTSIISLIIGIFLLFYGLSALKRNKN